MTFLLLTDEQRLLQEAAAEYIRTRLPVGAVRELVERGEPVGGDYLAGAAELGWFGTLVPEDLGGGSVSGCGLADLSVLAELRGRQLQPGPFVGTNVVAFAVARAGSPSKRAELLPLLAAGTDYAAWVTGELVAGAETVGVAARPSTDGVVLDGISARVLEARDASWFLVTVKVDDDLRQFVVPRATAGIEVAPLETLDLTTDIAEVRFDDVTLPADSELAGGEGAARDAAEQLAVASTLTTADAAGAMARLLEMTIDYAQDREAFGRAIGAFQAVKHQIADASLLVHASKSAAGAATDALAAGHPSAVEVASIAKAFVSDAAFPVAQICFQVHGGIGYAWEHDLHLYLRRLASASALYGDAAFHRAQIIRLHGRRRHGLAELA